MCRKAVNQSISWCVMRLDNEDGTTAAAATVDIN